MLPPVKKSIPCCSHTSKSIDRKLFWTVFLVSGAWPVHISLLIHTHILAWSNSLKLKTHYWWIYNGRFSLLKMLTDGLEWCGLLVDYCNGFSSCLDSHSDGTHSLQRIHWWASDVMLNFSKSLLMKKETHIQYILDGLSVTTFSANLNFGVNTLMVWNGV